jgi:hypothetical protein
MMKKSVGIIASLLLFPAASFACSVCFGEGNTNLTRGFFWGIIVLGALPFLMISGFIGYIAHYSRKRKQ